MSARLLLYSSTPRDVKGGVYGVYSQLARRLGSLGYDVVQGWADKEAGDGDDVWVCPLEFRVGVPAPVLAWRAAEGLGRLALRLARLRPALINVHFVRGDSLYFCLLKGLFGFKLILSFHGTDGLHPTPLARRALPFMLSRADAVTAVSRPLEIALRTSGASTDKLHLTPNGVDCAFWTPSRPQERTEALASRIVAVGNLNQVKGLDVLLRAFARLREDGRLAAQLTIVGEGQERRALQELAARLRVAEKVTFAGHLDAEGVREALRNASVLAMPSRSEGMPLALLEAMAVGLPIVATRVGAIPEVLTPDCGALVFPDEPEQLAAALAKFLDEPGIAAAAGAAARRRARAFSASRLTEAYAEVFAAVLGSRAPAIGRGRAGAERSTTAEPF